MRFNIKDMSTQEINLITQQLDRIEKLALLNAKAVINMEEASLLTGFSIGHLYRLTSGRGIPHFKKGRKVFFNKSELEAWLQDTRVKTQDEIDEEAERYLSNRKLSRR